MRRTKQALYRSLAGLGNENQFFLNLIELLQREYDETLEQIVKAESQSDMLRLQGQARALKNLRANLTRKPVGDQHSGAFV